MLWTDEVVFTRSVVHNLHNLHVWAAQNSHATRQYSFQQGFCVNVLARIVADYVIIPYAIQAHPGGAQHINLLEETLPLLSEDVPLPAQQCTSSFCISSGQLP
jgi:hypothetical protein